MAKQFRTALITFLMLTLITGVLYPLAITLMGQVVFPAQANGSLIESEGKLIGSTLIGQQTDDPAYFWSRPSAVNGMETQDGTLVSSGASNYGWTSAPLAQSVMERAALLREAHNLSEDAQIPGDLLYASGSGIDPHISPEAAAMQIERVAAARGVAVSQVAALVAQFTEGPQLGFLGQPRVNVLLLNLALDALP